MTGSRNLSGDREQTRSEALEHRMLLFAADIIRNLKGQTIPISVTNQLIRSSASIGVNYAEACNATSKADFRNKIFIAKKEAAETRYWIDLCIELTSKEIWSSQRQEAHELLVILKSIVNSLDGKSEK